MSEENKAPQVNWADVVSADAEDFPVDGNRRKPIPEGEYLAEIETVEYKQSESEGSKAVGVKFIYKITEGEQKGRKVRDSYFITNKAGAPNKIGMGQLKARLLSFGLTADQILTFRFPKVIGGMGQFEDFITRKAKITVKHETQKAGPSAGMTQATIKKAQLLPEGQ